MRPSISAQESHPHIFKRTSSVLLYIKMSVLFVFNGMCHVFLCNIKWFLMVQKQDAPALPPTGTSQSPHFCPGESEM